MSRRPGLRVIVAAGGTGGHVFPGLALARSLASGQPPAIVTFAGTARGVETREVPNAGFELDLLPILPLSRRLTKETLLAPFAALRAVPLARALVRRRGADVVVGMGGYVTLPIAYGAMLAGVPVVLHEQNAIPGLANRLAARTAAQVALAVPEAAGAFRGRPTVVVGNPVRAEVTALDRERLRPQALSAFGLEPERRTLLVFGGSQGARRLNQAVVASAGLWPRPELTQILHACGRRDEAMVRAGWADAGRPAGLLVRVAGFVDRMDLAYAVADLALTRAGATTLAELTNAGVPAVLVPLPHATADHQAGNARAIASGGGAVMVPDADLDATRLVSVVAPLLADRARLAAMGLAMRALAHPDAADELAEVVREAARLGEAAP